MAKIYKKPSGAVIMKFNSKVKKFRRVEKVVYGKDHFKLYIDKNNSVWEVLSCKVLSWKTIEKGHKKINVPDQVEETRDLRFFNIVKGMPFELAANCNYLLRVFQFCNNSVCSEFKGHTFDNIEESE